MDKAQLEPVVAELFGEFSSFWWNGGDELVDLTAASTPQSETASNGLASLAARNLAQWSDDLCALIKDESTSRAAAGLVYSTIRKSLPLHVRSRLVAAAEIGIKSRQWEVRRFCYSALLASDHPSARSAAVDFIRTRSDTRKAHGRQLLESRLLPSSMLRPLGEIARMHFREFKAVDAVQWDVRDFGHRIADMRSENKIDSFVLDLASRSYGGFEALLEHHYYRRPARAKIVRKAVEGLSSDGLMELLTDQPLNASDLATLDQNAAELLGSGDLDDYYPPRDAFEAKLIALATEIDLDLSSPAGLCLASIETHGDLVDCLACGSSTDRRRGLREVAVTFWDPAVARSAFDGLASTSSGLDT